MKNKLLECDKCNINASKEIIRKLYRRKNIQKNLISRREIEIELRKKNPYIRCYSCEEGLLQKRI